MQWTNDPPTVAGFYYFAPTSNDLPKVVEVRRIESPIAKWTEAHYRGEWGEWIDTRSQRFAKSLWFGPIPYPPKLPVGA